MGGDRRLSELEGCFGIWEAWLGRGHYGLAKKETGI